MKWKILKNEKRKNEVKNEEDIVGINSLVMGNKIEKGCSDVVYEDRKKIE
jgi:hypothetical protein